MTDKEIMEKLLAGKKFINQHWKTSYIYLDEKGNIIRQRSNGCKEHYIFNDFKDCIWSEVKEELLNDEEKAMLKKYIVEPFATPILSISLMDRTFGIITFSVQLLNCSTFILKAMIPKEEYYRKLELNKEYSLKDLDL